jgi:hypothetical protein
MITTRAMPAPLPAHQRRVAPQTTIKKDFADPLHEARRVETGGIGKLRARWPGTLGDTRACRGA